VLGKKTPLRCFRLSGDWLHCYTRHSEGPVCKHIMSFFTRDFLRETSPSKRMRFGLIDLVLIALVIILLVLVVRDLMY
jgi:hypothetical protein